MRFRWLMVPCFVLLLCASVFAGDILPQYERDVDDLEDLLPHHESALERERWLGIEHLMPRRDSKADTPPQTPIINLAEWEPATGVIIRYPLGLPYALLRDMDDDVTLHVVVASNYLSSAQSNLATNGVDMGKVEFLVKDNDSIWTRDYGPWYVIDGQDRLCIIDHTYNRPWRPNDNLIPIHFADQQGLPVFSHDMYHTGGNYMTDGLHLGMSTVLVYNEAASENGMTPTEVDQLMDDYYGLTTYHTLDYIESGGIHHIDTWAKFLDEETVLLKRVWPAHATYDDLEQRAVLLASLTASTGRNYQVHRVDCNDIGFNDPASFTNSLILNDHIYVPLFGDAAADTAALQSYRIAAPGYDVRGYFYSGFITDDALHCRTKLAHDVGMLRVSHLPILEATEGPVAITAAVKALSGQPVTDVLLHWRQDGGDWQQVTMNAQRDSTYLGTIPGSALDATIDYYILATDAGGRQEGAPHVAPAHWHTFDLLASTTDVSDFPAAVQLRPNVPNPFNPSTTFSFELRDAAPVHLMVTDPRGRVVRRLLNGETSPAGDNEIRWDGRDDAGRNLPSGTYLFVLEAAGLRYSRAATLVR